MIIIKEKDRICIAYSLPYYSRLFNTNVTLETMKNGNNFFFWKVKGHKNCIMGGIPTMVYNDILRYDESIMKCKSVNYDNVLSKVLPRILEKNQEYNGIDENNFTRNWYFIAKDETGFVIQSSDLTEIEFDESSCYFAKNAKTALYKYRDLPVYERLVAAAKDVALVTKEMFFPLLYTDTKCMKVKLIYEDGTIEDLGNLPN